MKRIRLTIAIAACLTGCLTGCLTQPSYRVVDSSTDLSIARVFIQVDIPNPVKFLPPPATNHPAFTNSGALP